MKAALLAALDRSPAAFTDIRIERRWLTAVTVRGRRLELVATTADRTGLVRCVSPGHAWGAASVATPDDLPAAVQRAHERSLAMGQSPPIALAPVPPRQVQVGVPSDRDPRAVPLARKRALALAAAATLLDADRRVTDCRVRYADAVIESWIATSEGALLTEWRPELSLSVLATAEEDGALEQALASRAVPGTWEDLEDWAAGLPRVARRAVDLLRAMPMRAAHLPVVLDPQAAGLLAHRIVAHLCQADATDDAIGPLPAGTRVGPDDLTVGDDGTALGLRGTLAWDQEGTPAQNTTLIRNGVVVHHVHTRATAGRAGAPATGNARTVGTAPPVARLTNTYVANGRGELVDLLRGLDEGVYLADPVGVTLLDGRATLRAGHARMIRRGELAEPVKGAVLTGDALTLFSRVNRIAGDFVWDRSAGRCARCAAGTVPVSTGAPHLRLAEAAIVEASA